MRVGLTLFFTLLGVYGFFRSQGHLVLGYLLFTIPLAWFVFQEAALGILAQRRLTLTTSGMGLARRWQLRVFWIYIGVVVAGFLRAMFGGTRSILVGSAEAALATLVAVFMWMAVVRASDRGEPDTLLNDVSVSLFLYVALNVFAAAFGIGNTGIEAKYNRELLTIFGSPRVIYPFTFSGQMFAVDAGMLAVVALLWWIQCKAWRRRVVGLSMFAASVAALAGHGARGPIAACGGVLLLGLLGPRIRQRSLPFVAVGVLFGTAWLVLGDASLLGELARLFEGRFSRQPGDIATLSNRLIIWAVVLSNVRGMGPWHLLFGHGAHGQVSSGISYQYSFLFEASYAEPYMAPTHNTFLQVFLDYGLFGLTIFILLIVLVASSLGHRLSRGNAESPSVGAPRVLELVLLYLLICSITEVAITYYSLGAWAVFVLVCLISSSRRMPSPTREGSRGGAGQGKAPSDDGAAVPTEGTYDHA